MGKCLMGAFNLFVLIALTSLVLTIIDQSCPEKCIEKINISLPRKKEATGAMREYKNHADWEAFAKQILDFRGPRW